MMIGSDELEQFVCCSNKAVEFKFVRSQEDFTDEKLSFSPEYTHQIFGEHERIYGYLNLKIQLYYSPDYLDTFLSYTYDDKVDPLKHFGTKPDDIFGAIMKVIPPGFTTSQEQFLDKLSQRRPFIPFGELIHKFMTNDGKQYEIYKCDICTPGFNDYHERLQTFVLWYIDAASYIDTDDDRWTFYLIYQKSTESFISYYSIVGYLTMYNYYAYPDKIRPRISQVLVLPPYQRKGIGTQLLKAVYNDVLSDSTVLEILVEDPSPEFTCLRDYVDCQNALKLLCLRSPICPYTSVLEKECQEKLKIGKNQCRRVYEILKLKSIDRSSPEEYYNYRIFVKNRLNGPYQKQAKVVEKLRNLGIMDQSELAVASASFVSKEDRIRELQQLYDELEIEYQNIIEKLATD